MRLTKKAKAEAAPGKHAAKKKRKPVRHKAYKGPKRKAKKRRKKKSPVAGHPASAPPKQPPAAASPPTPSPPASPSPVPGGPGAGAGPGPVLPTPGTTGHPAAGLVVTNEVLWSTDPRVGLDPSSTSDQTSQLQSLANLLTQSPAQKDRVGYLVPGTYVKSAPITFAPPTGHFCFKLLGRGSKGGARAASVIWDTVDGGNGTYSLNITGSAGFVIDGISLAGSQASPSPGSVGWQMRGICLPTYCTVKDVAVQGYFSGLTLMGDHMLIADFDVRGNTYGIDFGPNAVTQGDVIVRRGLAGRCTMGAIGVARSGTMAGARFQDVDCSATPYGIRRYDDGTGTSVPNWINGVDFINMGTDNIGNAVVCNTVDTAGILNVNFDHGYFGNPGLYSGPADPNGPQLAAWYSHGTVSVKFLKSLPTFTTGQPAVLAPYILGVTCPQGAALPAACASGAKPFALLGNVGAGPYLSGTACGQGQGGNTLVVPYEAEAPISRGCCVTPLVLYDVAQYAGSGSVLGMATHDASPGEVVHVVTNGIAQQVFNSSGADIPTNALLVPHPEGGVAAGSYGNGQVIGRAAETIRAGAIGSADLRLNVSV